MLNIPVMAGLRANFRWLLRYWLLAALLFMALGLRYWSWLAIPPSNKLAVLYLALTQIGWFGLFAIAGLLVTAPLLVLPRRGLQGICIACGLVIALLLVTDTLVFDQFRFHLNGFVFTLFFHGGDTISFSWLTWLIAAIGGGALAMVLSVTAWLAGRAGFTARYVAGGFGAILLALGASQGIHAWEDANYQPVIPGYTDTFPLYYPLTARSALVKWGLVDAARVDAERRIASRLDGDRDGHFHYPLTALQAQPPKRPPNIVFIMIDAWRYDDANPATTPHVADFARQAVTFSQQISGGNSTQAGIFSLFYGIPATYFSAAVGSGRRPALMQALAEQHYQFSIHGSANINHPPFDRTVFAGIEPLAVTTPATDASPTILCSSWASATVIAHSLGSCFTMRYTAVICTRRCRPRLPRTGSGWTISCSITTLTRPVTTTAIATCCAMTTG